MTSSYGASPKNRRRPTISRDRWSDDRIEQFDSQILSVLTMDHPQSVRHVYYRMTDTRLLEPVEKTELGYRRVGDRMTKLRRATRLPYEWVTDSTRRGIHTPTFSSVEDFLLSMKDHYRADLWQDSDFYCEVWTESRSIAGVIEADCRELAVSLYPAGGFTSITLAHQAAETMNAYASDKLIRIFYIGDYDPAGVLIDVVIERELRQHLNLADPARLRFERIAITSQQIIEYDLPTKPRKQGDRRAQHIRETVEAEAMPAGILRDMLRARIEALLPRGALDIARAEEESARAFIEQLARIERG